MVASFEDGGVHKSQSDSEEEFVVRKKHVCNKFVDSDSDEERVFSTRGAEEDASAGSGSDDADTADTRTKKKRRILVRSDSELDDDAHSSVNIPEPTECVAKCTEKFSEESSIDLASPAKTVNLAWYKDSTLYDAEGSDDETPEVMHNSSNDVDLQESEPTAIRQKNKQQKSKPSAKSTKQPSKPDKTEVQKIYSESQRMLRETKLSLPYHKPRQRTLTEFLQRRRSLPPMPKSLKVSSEQMKEICKQLEEREKEAKEFFKSESEDSDVEGTPGDVDGDGDGVVNEGSLTKLCTSTDKISEVTNEGTPDRENEKTEVSTVGSDKNELHEAVGEVVLGTNEENQKENVEGIDNAANIGDITEDGLVSGAKGIQVESKSHADEVETPQSITLKLFGSCVGGSDTVTGEISATDTEATTPSILLSKNIANSKADSSYHSAFKPSMSECSQAALDCAYEETVTDSFKFKEPVQPVVPETTTELDSQGLVLCMSEEFDKDEESQERVPSAKESEQNPINSVTNTCGNQESSENVGDGSEVGMNKEHDPEKSCIFTSAVSMDDCVNKPTESVLATGKNNLVYEAVGQNLSLTVDSDVSGMCENGHVSGLTFTNEDVRIQNEKAQDGPGSKVQVDLSKSVTDTVSDNDGVAGSSVKMDSTLEALHELELENEPKRGLESQSVLNDISNFRPRLIGDTTDVIDLEVVPKPAGIRKLIERFMKHSSSKKKPKQKKQAMELGVVSAEKGPDGLEIVKKDVLHVMVGEDEDVAEGAEFVRPGEKFRRLKEELHQQITRQRGEEWIKREQEAAVDGTPGDDKGDCSPFEDELEEELTESESEEEEEEEEDELDNVKIREKKRTKSAFVDDEAELSDEGNAADVSSDEDEDEDDGNEDEDENDEGRDSGKSNVNENEEKAEVEDTLHENKEDDSGVGGSTQSKTRFRRLRTLDMFGSNGDSSEDDEGIEDTCPIPAYQPGGGMKCGGSAPLSEEKFSQRNFLSPIFSLPVRSSRASSVKSAGTPNSHQTVSSAENTPHTCEGRGLSRLHLTQKKLFAEMEPVATQENMEELEGLCSGKFDDVPRDGMENLVNHLTRSSLVDQDSELLALCSGRFESQVAESATVEGKDDWKDTTESQLPGDSQDLCLTLSEDVLSPVKPDQYREENTPQTILNLVSSDEESSGLKESIATRKVKHSHKRLAFSDDENEQVGPLLSTNVMESDDDGDSNAGSLHSEMVAYDSEENEIAVPAGRGKVRSLAEFFEDEAELSESEWDSADEDERGLDKMDSEEGDDEQLDNKKVKEQLDKIHMRRMMDDDNREVRLLQELLFEDGELHSEGGGRQRKFRWKNIDSLDENYQPPDPNDEDVYDIDDEDEEQWRRMRHQREKFLLEQQAKGGVVQEDAEPEDDSQLMRLGKAALKRIRSSNSQEPAQEKKHEIKHSASEPVVSPDPKKQFQLLVKRGSFLARGETALARLAQLTKGAADQNIKGPKNSRNFVFATISPEKEENSKKETAQVKVQKRKSVKVTPPVIKRLRLSEEVAKSRCLLDLLVP